MKIVFHNDEQIIDVIENVEDLVIDEANNSFNWKNGSLSGASGKHIVVEDDVDIKVGDLVTAIIDVPKIDKPFKGEDKEMIQEIVTRTAGMQEIDDFTLQLTSSVMTRTEGMQEIDDFTLMMVFELQEKFATLEARIETLENKLNGGNV